MDRRVTGLEMISPSWHWICESDLQRLGHSFVWTASWPSVTCRCWWRLWTGLPQHKAVVGGPKLYVGSIQMGSQGGVEGPKLAAWLQPACPVSPKHDGIIAGNLQWATPRLLNWHQSGGYCTTKVCHPQLQTLHNYCGLKGILFNFDFRNFSFHAAISPSDITLPTIESNSNLILSLDNIRFDFVHP